LKDLLIMKFGGTSVGSADRMRAAAALTVEQRKKRPIAIVVSAMSKITDLLLDSMKHAEAGDRAGLEANLKILEQRHVEACCALLPGDRVPAVLTGIRELIEGFERIARGMLMLGERPPKSVDEAVATGERLSALMIAAYLESAGFHATALNAWNIIVTDGVYGNATPLMEPTREKAVANVLPHLDKGIIPVITGFNGATVDGRPTTLGRGGSDFSAAILAAALDASELWIWTDVDGIMTADPRLVPDAAVLQEVTYHEAAELAYNGAKVLHPRTLAPLADRKIPVWSKNSFSPEKPGTRIVSTLANAGGARAVTSTANVVLLSIEPASDSIIGTQVMGRALEALGLANVEVLLVSSSSFRQSFSFLVRKEELTRTMEALESALALEFAHGYLAPLKIDENVGLLAVVGEGMRGMTGVAGRIFTAISREQVNIIAIAQGSSELTIAIVVGKAGLEKAVRAVHAECGMSSAHID
jgi:aspartate kinase